MIKGILLTKNIKLRLLTLARYNFMAKKDSAQLKKDIVTIYRALCEKGYDPSRQIAGYILSEDPTYITSHRNARGLISKLDRDELLDALAKFYFTDIIVKK